MHRHKLQSTMLPHFNPNFWNPNNQLQLNGANAAAPQQAMGNQVNLGQMRPQFPVGVLNNPQLAMPPFPNPNAYFAPNPFLPFPQGAIQNLSANNLPHLVPNNSLNPSQFLPNGQLNFQNLVQNVSVMLQMQMMSCGPQNLGPFLNAQPGGRMNNGVVPQSVDGNGLKLMNQNAAVTKDFGSLKAPQNENLIAPGAPNSQNNAGVVHGVNGRQNNWRNPQNKNFNGNHNYDASQRGLGNRQSHHQQNAPGNFKFNNDNRGKGNQNFGVKKFNSSNPSEQIQVGKKRSLTVNYSEQEIRQWREQRKKNYPSNANMEKLKEEAKKAEADAVSKMRRQQLKEILAKQAELGCEVAEIPSSYLSDSEQQTGFRQQNNKSFGKRERFHNKFDRRGKFQKGDRFSKRQRHENSYPANSPNQSERFTRNQRQANGSNTNRYMEKKREPSLLKKLLSSEIKKDKKHLLQVFRFMVMNSFFEDSPEKPLKYPVVIVKEAGDESEIIDLKAEAMKVDTVCTDDDSDSVSIEDDAVDKNAGISSRGYDDDEVEVAQPPEDGEIME